MRRAFFIALITIVIISCKNDDDADLVQECLAPTTIQFSELSQNEVLITWDENNSSGYSLEYGFSGFTLGSGTVVEVSNSNTKLAGLENDTAYDVYIRSICGNSQKSEPSSLVSFNTVSLPIAAEFLTNLSDLNLYSGAMNALKPNSRAFEYELTTPLFTDYSKKQRIIALPEGTAMQFIDNELPDFPDNTVIAKTFYYNSDDRDESLGKTIIETRVFIKTNGEWKSGNYKWNAAQTNAVFTAESEQVPINFIDNQGETKTIDYVIPDAESCVTCHSKGTADILPIGPKLRAMNMNNQIQELINANYLVGLNDVSSVSELPKWDDESSYTLEERGRAYFDMQCAHCHSEGGSAAVISKLRLEYETPFNESAIRNSSEGILERAEFFVEGFSMPSIGTTLIHEEGFDLMKAYIDSL